MGGFSASYAVHCADDQRVCAGIEKLVADEGWHTSLTPLDDEAMWGFGGSQRGIVVCRASGGWTPVIDSAAMVAPTPESLSAELQTSVVNLTVHDSDFWNYTLLRSGIVDSYSSMNMEEYFGGDAPASEGPPQRTLDERWELLSDHLADGVTREAFDRVFTPMDMNNLQDWVGGEEGLSQFLELLGIEPSLAWLSYRYWMETPGGHEPLEEIRHFLLAADGASESRDLFDEDSGPDILPFPG